MNLCTAGLFLILGIGTELGPSSDRHLFGREPTGIAGIECQMNDNWSLDYLHHSSIPDGAPFNDTKGVTSDVISLKYRFRLK